LAMHYVSSTIDEKNAQKLDTIVQRSFNVSTEIVGPKLNSDNFFLPAVHTSSRFLYQSFVDRVFKQAKTKCLDH
jgi:hypothetical protein